MASAEFRRGSDFQLIALSRGFHEEATIQEVKGNSGNILRRTAGKMLVWGSKGL